MKIGIVSIATGIKYNNLYKQLLVSIYKNFLPTTEKKICLIGDDRSSLIRNEHFIAVTHLPRPLAGVLRYYYLKMTKDYFSDCEVIYYLDADLTVVATISLESILPENKDQFVVVHHPWAKSQENTWILENNPKSAAYIANVDRYYQSCFYGGYKDNFFALVDQLDVATKIDLENRIIAKWFDESYFNKYLSNKPCKVLPPTYAYPRSFEPSSTAQMIHNNSHTMG